MAASIPLTRNSVSEADEAFIRASMKAADGIPGGHSRKVTEGDAPALFSLLSDPKVHAPIYSLPRPLTLEAVQTFIRQHLEEQAAGEGGLFVRIDEAGEIVGYSDVQLWPQWGAGELGGALHPKMHSKGAGTKGAAVNFNWMFEGLGLHLICATAALDNVPSQRLIDHLGFTRMGEITSTRPDGTTRQSLVWEMTREDWRARDH